VHDLVKYPFLSVVQSEKATHLVFMRHWTFHRLAEDLGDPKHKEVHKMAKNTVLIDNYCHSLQESNLLLQMLSDSMLHVNN